MSEEPRVFASKTQEVNHRSRRPIENTVREIQELLDLDYNLRQISKMTGFSYGYIRVLVSKYIRSKEDNKIVILKNCPDCGNQIKKIGSETVCTTCGLVVKEEPSFGQGFSSQFEWQGGPALECSTDWGKGLGTKLQGYELYRIIAKGIGSKSGDLLPIQQIKTLSQTRPHPTIRNLLEKGSKLLTKHGFRIDDGGAPKPEHVFAQTFSDRLRRIGSYYVYGDIKIKNGKKLVAAVFYLTLRDFFGPAKAEALRPDLSFKDEDLAHVTNLLGSLMEVKKHGKKAAGE